MSLHYRTLGGSTTEKKSKKKVADTALFAFTGKCHLCGEIGHKGYQCPKDNGKSTQASRNNKSTKKCNLCGKKGHITDNCFELECNKGNRPNNWKSSLGKDTANAAVAKKSISAELLMCVVTGTTGTILDDPEIFVLDTAATGALTNSSKGMSNLGVATENDAVIVGNKQVMKGHHVGSLAGTICDKTGNELMPLTISRITYSPEAAFNLFSPSILLSKGWELHGNHDMMWFTKDGNKIVFAIKVTTPNGMLFCIRFKRTRSEEIAQCAIKSTPTDKPVSEANSVTVPPTKTKKYNVCKIHCLLGHVGQQAAKDTAEVMGWTITKSTIKPCEPCAVGKARR